MRNIGLNETQILYLPLQININIQDINDNPPQFGFQYDTKTIPENLSTGTCFFPLPVEDPDLNTKVDNHVNKRNMLVNILSQCLEIHMSIVKYFGLSMQVNKLFGTEHFF